jgi:HlyD family secretion protein
LAAEVSPATVKKEEWGYILGTVRAVGELAVSPAGMQAVLDNPDLVKSFTASGPQLALNISLRLDKRNPSGFRWSSKSGPNVRITPGTLAGAQIIVREQPPITLVIPALKKFFGLD